MLENTNTMNTGTDQGSGTLFRTRLFLSKHGPALEAAVELLGGRRWSGRLRQLCADVSDGSLPWRVCLRELEALLGLLRLELVDDLTSYEAACFAVLDPADSHIDEICKLTDALARLLDEYQEVHVADDGHA